MSAQANAAQRDLLLMRKQQVEESIRERFAEARRQGKDHKPGVKVLSKELRKIRRQLAKLS